MPSGKVKWYDPERGFGFITQDDGQDVYVRAQALPEGVDSLRAGQRVEIDVASGRRGWQALRVEVKADPPSVERTQRARQRDAARRDAEARRPRPDQLHGMVEDLIAVLDGEVQPNLRRGRFPDRATGRKVAEIMRAVARNLDT